ncbi:hypothetical protein DPMN_008653 [Dreissena polymorpha]|uniref:Uncharacterized protein n=1 Tax=Dreissena polymorpha TaxID=45954 RepID=A0A9D4N0U6_DREPO|nr:hypothetical protein DPMN_008653 [Dreissena polymorpha]
MNLLTKFHEDQTINVASREKKYPALWQPCFSSKHWTINVASRELTRQMLNVHDGRRTTVAQNIIGTNLLTKFHEDRKIMWPLVKIAPPPGSHVFKPTGIIFVLVLDITLTNAPPSDGHVFQATGTIFELVKDIIGTNLLTKVLTRKKAMTPWRPYITGTNCLAKFHDDRTINVASRVNIYPYLEKCPAPWPYIIGTNLLTKFHEDRKINVASRVLTRFYYNNKWKNALPPGSHVFQPIGIIF